MALGNWRDSELWGCFVRLAQAPMIKLVTRVSEQGLTDDWGLELAEVWHSLEYSTFVLEDAFPQARIHQFIPRTSPPQAGAVGDSPYPTVTGRNLYLPDCTSDHDGRGTTDSYDAVFSTWFLPWAPDHRTLVGTLMRMVRPGGFLALHVPLLAGGVALCPVSWGLTEFYHDLEVRGVGRPVALHALSTTEYAAVLAGCSSSYELWEENLPYRLEGVTSVEQWYRSSGMSDLAEALADDGLCEALGSDLIARLEALRPTVVEGGIELCLRSVYLVARK